ncbi:MAG: hypothetical protein HKN21_10765 [Candidatus Eisenbacteria bacterium]|uniref:Uncharacterized protein n=1 Tax=Eiseniibacteriota bacterium TaxID=2212470 RepID=A0A7Y2E8N3_UNCEI|nr:hypothetical protein [Candidatus Eisenbacteria bacterium]
MSRRSFIQVVAAASIPFGIGGAFGCAQKLDTRRLVKASFLQHFHYLEIDPEGLEQFLIDYEEALGPIQDGVASRDELPFTRFLESTDFFLQGQDESKPVKYLALYDPYANPCFYPFRRFES